MMSVGLKGVGASAERWMNPLRDGLPEKSTESITESYRFGLIRVRVPIRMSDAFGGRYWVAGIFFTPRFVFVGAGSKKTVCRS